RVIAERGWSVVDEIDEFGTTTAVRGFRKIREPKRKLSVASQNHYFTAMKAFTAWLTDVRKVLMRDPLKGLKKSNPERDRRRIRRFLLPDEWPYLAKTPNAILYRTAIETGFRASELMALDRSMLKKDHIRLPAELDKRGKVARQYINPSLRAKLSLPFEVVGGTPDRLAELLATDLEIARANYLAECEETEQEPGEEFLARETSEGVLDFHALRHSCGAWLVLKEVNIKIVQKVMRHSTIKLTLDTYGHLMPGAEREAVSVLRDVFE
ncbi:MAG: tyrosine-type recombinase/integrase, partial [Planctomycetota bacterium]